MRFLADAGLSPVTVDFLTQLGHEAAHVGSLGMQRAPDVDIVERARADSSVASPSIWILVTSSRSACSTNRA
jgi:predicted nuclease of predicted toxin-antitoxin system